MIAQFSLVQPSIMVYQSPIDLQLCLPAQPDRLSILRASSSECSHQR